MERGWEHLRLRRAAVPVRPEAPVLCTCAEGFPARHGREQFSTSAQKTDTVPPAHLPVFRARLGRAGTSVSRPERSPRSCPGQGFPRCWPAELTPSGDGQNAGPGTAHGQNGARGRERGRPPEAACSGASLACRSGRPTRGSKGLRLVAAPTQLDFSLLLLPSLFELIKSQESKCQNVFVPEAVSLPFGSLVHAERVCQPGTLA